MNGNQILKWVWVFVRCKILNKFTNGMVNFVRLQSTELNVCEFVLGYVSTTMNILYRKHIPYLVHTERVCDLYMQQIKSLIRCEYGHIWLHCCIYIRKEMEQYRRCEKPVSTQPKRFRSKISSDDDHDRMTLTSESRSHLVWAFEWEIWKCNTPPF